MASPYERQIALQLGIAEVVSVAGAMFYYGAVPKPRHFIAVALPFAALSLVEGAGPKWQKVSSIFGWFLIMGMCVLLLPANPNSPNPLEMIANIGNAPQDLFPDQVYTPPGSQLD